MNGCMPLIGAASEWSENALLLALYAGACAGLLATVVLVINALFRRWLSARQMGLLWGIVLLRLLVPVAPSSPVSVQNLLTPARVESVLNCAICELCTDPGSTPDSQPFDAGLYSQPQSQALTAPETAPQAIDLSSTVELFFTVLPLTWLSVGVGCLIWTTLVHWQFCRRLKHAAASEDHRLRSLWDECCKLAGVRRSIPILPFDGVQQPAVLGLFRPKLLLPAHAMELNDQQLRMVMLHELAHVRHWDIAANWALVFIRAFHWWNPVYWLAATRYQSLREQSCDTFAIRRIEGQPTRSYSELLLTLAQRPPSGPRWRILLPVSILGFLSSFFRKRAIHNRLKALRSAGITRSRWHTAGVAGLVALLAACGLTDASTPETPPVRSSDWLSREVQHGDWKWNAEPLTDLGPSVTRTYDIEKALNRIAVDERTKEDARVNVSWVLVHMLRGSTGHYRELTDAWAQEQFAIDGDTLTVNAPLRIHAEIVRRLNAWEQSGLCQISVGTQFITADKDIAATIGVSWRYLEAFSTDRDGNVPPEAKIGMPVVQASAAVDEHFPIAMATLNKQQVFALAQARQWERSATVVNAPKVTLFNGQQASFFNGTQRPFVVGIQDPSGSVQQPKVTLIDEGIKTTCRAILSSDASNVQLEGHVDLSEVSDVGTASTLLRGQSVTIQIPRVKRCRIDVASDVQQGQSLLICCIPTDEQKKFFYVLLTVRHVLPPAKEIN